MADFNQALGNLLNLIAQRLQQPVGPLLSNLRNSREMPPEIARLELYTFEATIGTDGTVSTQPNSVPTNPDFWSGITGMYGYMQKPSENFNELTNITFNIQEEGRGFNLFPSGDVNLAGLVDNTGTGRTREFQNGIYVVRPGVNLKATFTSAVSSLTTAKKVGVVLMAGLFRRAG